MTKIIEWYSFAGGVFAMTIVTFVIGNALWQAVKGWWQE